MFSLPAGSGSLAHLETTPTKKPKKIVLKTTIVRAVVTIKPLLGRE